MSSTSITSFFYQKPSQTTRSSTFTGNKHDADSMRRPSTLSKVKRFGSMLVRTNKQQRPTIDTTSMSIVRPSPSSASLVSSAATSNEDSEEEEHVMTPSASTMQFSKDVMMTVVTPSSTVVHYQMDLDMMSVTPKDQSNQPPTTVETLASEKQVGSLLATKAQTTPHRSDVFMAREQLRTIFNQVDVEIEQELESSHLSMLASIKTIPRTIY